MQPSPPVLVLCDLDDTLFEPHTLSVDASAHRALDRIAHERIPIVFCSSKTRAELELIQQKLGIHHPFICESGAAVFIPLGYFGVSVAPARHLAGYEVAEFGKPYAEVVGSLHRAAERLRMEVLGLHDMSVEQVALECDLPLLQARLAKLREYNEMFRVVDGRPGALVRLCKTLRAAGIDCTSRGRYHHTGTIASDIASRFLCGLYRRAFGEVLTVAFGDHASTVPLLRHADVPLVVQDGVNEATARLLTAVPRARLSVADSIGAWAGVILDIASAAQNRGSACSS